MCVALWLFITVHKLENQLIWYDIWLIEYRIDENSSSTKTVNGKN